MSKQLEFIKQLISRKGKCYDVAKRQKSFEKELAASDRFQLMTDASQPGSAEQPPTAAQQPPGPAERPKSHAGRSTFAHSHERVSLHFRDDPGLWFEGCFSFRGRSPSSQHQVAGLDAVAGGSPAAVCVARHSLLSGVVPRMLLRRPGSDSVWSSASVTAAARAALSGSENGGVARSDAKDSQLIAGLSGYDRRAGLLYDDEVNAGPDVVDGCLERCSWTPLSISRSVAVDVRLDERQSISLWRQAENLTAAVAVLLLTLLFPGDDVHFPGAYGSDGLAPRTGCLVSRSVLLLLSPWLLEPADRVHRFVLSGFYDSGLEISSFERSGLLQGFAESDVRRLQEPAAQLIRLAAGDDLISDDRITLGLEFAALCCLEQALNPCVDRLARLLRAVPEFVTHEHGIVPAAEVSLQGVQELVKSPAGIRKFCVGFGDLLAADVEQNFVLLSRVLNAACSDEALETNSSAASTTTNSQNPLLHTKCSTWLHDMPGWHLLHFAAPALLELPAGHFTQAGEPLKLTKLPEGQGVQLDKPSVVAIEPLAHFWQLEEPQLAAKLPGQHLEQAAAPERLYEPGGHFWHLDFM
uniref:TPR_REGION domain-containing protein n=1 Tax=Macrostomum lignano TaxID=282301 RepID=A0A1I8GXC2_9PLAT